MWVIFINKEFLKWIALWKYDNKLSMPFSFKYRTKPHQTVYKINYTVANKRKIMSTKYFIVKNWFFGKMYWRWVFHYFYINWFYAEECWFQFCISSNSVRGRIFQPHFDNPISTDFLVGTFYNDRYLNPPMILKPQSVNFTF